MAMREGARDFRLVTEVSTIAKAVLRRRHSSRIVEIASARGDVCTLLAEYRAYLSESERQLARDGLRQSFAATETLREVWSDALSENRRWPAGRVN
jgi:uncharacterized membrane protein